MAGRSVTEKKLDMALDELVDRHHDSHERRERGYGHSGRDDRRDRHEPYGKGKDKGFGKGKGRERLPPQDKALFNTHCFFNSEGDFVVKLYDTEVFALKKRPESIVPDAKPAADADADADAKPAADVDAKPAADVDAKPAADADADAAPDATKGDAAPKDAAPKDAAPKDAAPKATTSQGGVSVVLSSGNHRTVETKYVINEALLSLSMRISEENDSSRWMVSGQGIEEQAFEDGMVVQLKDPMVRASVVKEHLQMKTEEAKARKASVHGKGGGKHFKDDGRPPQYGWHQGPPPPLHHWGPPPGHPDFRGHPPPPGWGPPPVAPWDAGRYPPPHHYGGHPPPHGHHGGPPGHHGGGHPPQAAPAQPAREMQFQ